MYDFDLIKIKKYYRSKPFVLELTTPHEYKIDLCCLALGLVSVDSRAPLSLNHLVDLAYAEIDEYLANLISDIKTSIVTSKMSKNVVVVSHSLHGICNIDPLSEV
jgi:hypothetical protein